MSDIGPDDTYRYNRAMLPNSPPVIAVIAFDGISPFHLSVPCLVFGEDRSEQGAPRFELLVCAGEDGPLRTSAGFGITPEWDLAALARADIVIVPSWREVGTPPAPPLLEALRQAHVRGARMVGLCLGAFVLGEAGLLTGRRVTTHWSWAQALAERYPAASVDRDVLYVDDGPILTSAGVAAGLDCCLHLLRELCGAEVANRVARRMVIAPHRQGGQAQFIEQPLPATIADQRLAGVLAWASAHMEEAHSVDALAARAAMSRRTFTRHFRKATGASVSQWVLGQRLARAKHLLETTGMRIEQVAGEAGFQSALSLRQHFQATLGTSPRAYRAAFRVVPTEMR